MRVPVSFLFFNKLCTGAYTCDLLSAPKSSFTSIMMEQCLANTSYTRYPNIFFTQIYRDLYGDAMLVLIRMSTNMADGNQQKHLLPSFATKA